MTLTYICVTVLGLQEPFLRGQEILCPISYTSLLSQWWHRWSTASKQSSNHLQPALQSDWKSQECCLSGVMSLQTNLRRKKIPYMCSFIKTSYTISSSICVCPFGMDWTLPGGLQKVASLSTCLCMTQQVHTGTDGSSSSSAQGRSQVTKQLSTHHSSLLVMTQLK